MDGSFAADDPSGFIQLFGNISPVEFRPFLPVLVDDSVSFPNLKPTTRAISIRLPEYLIDRLKEKAAAFYQ